jgi:hypothetical protein
MKLLLFGTAATVVLGSSTQVPDCRHPEPQGINKLSPSDLRLLTQLLPAGETLALFSTSRGLNKWDKVSQWSHNEVLKKVKSFEPLDRTFSWKLMYSPTLRAEVEEHFSDYTVYPITLNLHVDDLRSLHELEGHVFEFFSRVRTVVIEGADRLVIEARDSVFGVDVPNELQWGMAMYDHNNWGWIQPTSVMDVLQSQEVTAVKSLDLQRGTAELIVDLSWSVTQGHIKWTATKTSRLEPVARGGILSIEILLHRKLVHLHTLRLTLFDRSVLNRVAVFENLPNIRALYVSDTP